MKALERQGWSVWWDRKIPLAFRRIEAALLQDWDGVSEDPDLDNLLAAVTELSGRPTSAEGDRLTEEEAKAKLSVDESLDVETVAAKAFAEEVEEKTEFDVVLTAICPRKISVIKEVRILTGLGLKEAKDLVEGAPNAVMEGVSKYATEDAKGKLELAGAVVELK